MCKRPCNSGECECELKRSITCRCKSNTVTKPCAECRQYNGKSFWKKVIYENIKHLIISNSISLHLFALTFYQLLVEEFVHPVGFPVFHRRQPVPMQEKMHQEEKLWKTQMWTAVLYGKQVLNLLACFCTYTVSCLLINT